MRRGLLVVVAVLLATAGYAAAAGTLKIVRLHPGQSVRVGNTKVVALGPKTVSRLTTITQPAVTVTGPTTTVSKTITATTTVAVPGPVITVTTTTPTTTTTPSGPKTSFGDGTYRVNTDIVAGTYKAAGGSSCYWERLSGFGGTLDEIIANGFGDTNPIVAVASTDAGFHVSNCGTWSKI